MTALSPAIRKIAALTVLLAILGAAYIAIISPLDAKFGDLSRSIRQSQELLGRYDTIRAERAQLETTLADIRSREDADDLFLQGDSYELSVAELQNFVTRIVNANGGQLKSSQALTIDEDHGYPTVSVRMNFSAGMEPLVKILYQLETSRPYLFIRDLDIRVRANSRQLQRVRAGLGGDARARALAMLTVRLTAYAYARGGPSS